MSRSKFWSLISSLQREIDATYAALVPAIAALAESMPDLFPASTIDTFTKAWTCWAYCLLNSRSFSLSSSSSTSTSTSTEAEQQQQDQEEAKAGGKSSSSVSSSSSSSSSKALVPFMDLMNHASTAADATLVVGVDDETGALCAQAKRDLKAGEELCFQYRHGGDVLKFLFNYGFVPAKAAAAGGDADAEKGAAGDEPLQEAVYFLVDFPPSSSGAAAGASSDSAGDAPSPPPCDVVLGAALRSLGLPATMQLAIPATAADPFPDTWLWALRLLAMYKDSDVDHLKSFAAGEVKIRPEQEQAAWAGAADTLSSAYEWYETASEKLGTKKEEDIDGDGDGDSDGDDEALLRRLYQAALGVLHGALAIFIARTRGGQ